MRRPITGETCDLIYVWCTLPRRLGGRVLRLRPSACREAASTTRQSDEYLDGEQSCYYSRVLEIPSEKYIQVVDRDGKWSKLEKRVRGAVVGIRQPLPFWADDRAIHVTALRSPSANPRQAARPPGRPRTSAAASRLWSPVSSPPCLRYTLSRSLLSLPSIHAIRLVSRPPSLRTPRQMAVV